MGVVLPEDELGQSHPGEGSQELEKDVEYRVVRVILPKRQKARVTEGLMGPPVRFPQGADPIPQATMGKERRPIKMFLPNGSSNSFPNEEFGWFRSTLQTLAKNIKITTPSASPR
jgi:hypothetical protein